MNVLITGASSRIGRGVLENLDKVFNLEDEIWLTQRTSLIPDYPSFKKFNKVYIIRDSSSKFAPKVYDFVLHLAGVVDTKYCNRPENAREVIDSNVGLTASMCQSAKRVLFVSTDNVFSGNSEGRFYTEQDSIEPANFYGLSKACAERVVIHFGGVVVRVQSMLGVDNRLITPMVRTLQGFDHLPFWNNIFLRPAYLFDFLKMLRRIYIGEYRNVIYHCSCSGEPLSRFDIADAVLNYFRRHNIPSSREEMPQEVCTISFPRRLVLDTAWTCGQLSVNFTDVRLAIERHLDVLFEQA
ncbi:MAG: sugar nucleotide-binding protein [Candidatus Yanofskybacteria bacterium]|nr:sugar nucleotide-binding protein [Candidatus Yanofskybacteria bacterium]